MTRRMMKASLLVFVVITLCLASAEEQLNGNEQENRSQRHSYDKKEKVIADPSDEIDHVINKYADNSKNERLLVRKHGRSSSDEKTTARMDQDIESSLENIAETSTSKHDDVFSDETKTTVKEKLLLPVENPGAFSDEVKPIKQGVPFYIADDGKSIQLPKSDVIYNAGTGDILIRNRNTDKNRSEEKGSRLSKENGVNRVTSQDYFDVKPEGFKTVQGFVIADSSEGVTMPLLYPMESDSGQMNDIADKSADRTTENTLENVSEEVESKNDTLENSMEETSSSKGATAESIFEPTAETATKKYTMNDLSTSKKEDMYKSDDSKRIGKQTFSTEQDNVSHDSNSYDSEEMSRKYTNLPARKQFDESKMYTKYSDETYNDNYKSSDPSTSSNDRFTSEEITTMSPNIPNEKPELISGDLLNDALPRSESEDSAYHVDLSQTAMNQNDPTKVDQLDQGVAKPPILSLEDYTDMLYLTTTTQQPDPIVALRAYLEDIYLRGPIAIVIDTSLDSLSMVKDAWNAMEKTGGELNVTDIVLIAYDSNGGKFSTFLNIIS